MARRMVTSWLSHAWASEEQILFRYMEVMEEFPRVEFDTLVGTGISGAVIVPTLARLLGKDFAIVRKENDGTHGWHRVEGVVGRRWLFVDDLVSTGTTVRRVIKVMSEVHRDTEPVGSYLYDASVFRCRDEMDWSTED